MATTYKIITGTGATAYRVSTGGRGPQGQAATVDATITDGSTNAVSSNAVFDALALKAPLISPGFTNDISVRPPGFVVESITLAPNPSTGFLYYATPQGGHIRFKATYADLTVTNEYTFPDATGTIALTSDITGTNSGTNTGDETAARIATALNAGTEDTEAADTDKLAVTHPAGGWMALSTLWTWITGKINTLAKLDAIVADATLARTDAGQTFAGEQAFSSTTRPTSSGTGTPASNSLVTSADVDNKFAKVGAYKSVDQTALTASAYNKITFDVEEYDTHGAFASSTFTAPVAGYVAVTCRLLVSGSTSTDAIAVYKNGAQVKRLMSQTVATGTLVGGSAVVKVAANDTLEVYYYAQLSKTITGAATISWVQFTMIP